MATVLAMLVTQVADSDGDGFDATDNCPSATRVSLTTSTAR
jgi:hypothetical protein